MKAYDFTMSLGLRHPDIDPARITRALALEPQHVWRKGDRRIDEEGTALGGAHRESYWVCDFNSGAVLDGEKADVESELSRMLHTLRKSMAFMQDLRHGGGAAELFICIYANAEFRFSLLADEAALLGRLGITMTLEIKPGNVPARAPALS